MWCFQHSPWAACIEFCWNLRLLRDLSGIKPRPKWSQLSAHLKTGPIQLNIPQLFSLFCVLHVSFVFFLSLSQIESLFWELEFVLFLLFSLKVWSSDFKSFQGHSIKSTCVLCYTCRNPKDQTVWSVTFMVGCFYCYDILPVCQLAKPHVTGLKHGFWKTQSVFDLLFCHQTLTIQIIVLAASHFLPCQFCT